MPRAKFYYGTKSQLDSKLIENGALYLTTDEDKWYIDMDGDRHSLSGDVITNYIQNINGSATLGNKIGMNVTQVLNGAPSSVFYEYKTFSINLSGVVPPPGTDDGSQILYDSGWGQAPKSTTVNMVVWTSDDIE